MFSSDSLDFKEFHDISLILPIFFNEALWNLKKVWDIPWIKNLPDRLPRNPPSESLSYIIFFGIICTLIVCFRKCHPRIKKRLEQGHITTQQMKKAYAHLAFNLVRNCLVYCLIYPIIHAIFVYPFS